MNANTEIDQFAAEGYCIVRNGIGSAEIAALRESLDLMVDRQVAEGKRPERLVEPHITAQDWRLWLELCRHPRVTQTVVQALGTDELILLMSHLIVKPPRDGMPVKWHQDNTYWPSVTGSDVLTVWLAIDDVDEANGCMKVIPRTQEGHRELETRKTDGNDLLAVEVIIDEAVDGVSSVPCVLRAGDFSIHDSYIVHGSDPNFSDRRRAGFTMRIGNARTVEVDLEGHRRPVYYIHGNGQSLNAGYRDISRGRPLPEDPGKYTARS